MTVATTASREESRQFLLALINHILWSTLSPASRYLQVFAEPMVFDGQGILATCKATSAILVAIWSQLVLVLCHPADADEQPQDNKEEIKDEQAILPPHVQQQQPQPPPSAVQTKIFFALLFGIIATCRAALNISSAKFTLSYYITAINSLSPLVVSLGDKLWLQADLPSAIWPCILASIVGCATIAASQSPILMAEGGSNHDNHLSFTSQDAIGCALQFMSMCFSAAARLLMKRTEHVLTRTEAVQTNNVCNCIFPLIYTLVVNPGGWKAFQTMSLQSFGAWTTIAVLVYTIGSTGQMALVRSMGPGVYSSLGATRVLGSVVLSALWLHEPVQNWLEWIGLFIIMCTMTLYTLASIDVRNSWGHLFVGTSDLSTKIEWDDGNDTADEASSAIQLAPLISAKEESTT